MDRTFPVATRTIQYKKDGTELYFPQVVSFHDQSIKKKINDEIERTVFNLITRQKESQGVADFDQMIGLYEIKTNERNVLSLTLSNYAIHKYFAHGLTFIESLTFDLLTGESVQLSELFKPDSAYRERLAKEINLQITTRDIPLLVDGPVTVKENQDYYLADKSIVIYYQLYEITPYYVGLPMFPISIYYMEDIIRPKGVLERMLAY